MPFFKVLIFWYNKGVFRKRMRLVNFKEIVQMCAKNFAHIKKNTTNVVFFLVELLTTRKGGEIACKKRRRPQATSAPHGYKPCISFHCKMK